MSAPHVKLYSEKHGDRIVYEGIAGQPMFDYLAEHGPTWGIAESDTLRQAGTFRRRPDGSWYDIDLDPGGASGYGAAWLNPGDKTVARIYIVCDTSEGVHYAVGIQGVYLDKDDAIAKCEELGAGANWVWEFRPGQGYGEAVEVWPAVPAGLGG